MPTLLSIDNSWIPTYEDVVESGEFDFDVDIVDPSFEHDDGLTQWCIWAEAFAPRDMQIDKLVVYYRKSSWNSDSVCFIGSQDNFTGPTLGLKCPQNVGLLEPERVFNLYWTDETLDCIVLETNRYVGIVLPHKCNEVPCTKGGPTWIDVDCIEFRDWIGICILMDCKKLPSIEHYILDEEEISHVL